MHMPQLMPQEVEVWYLIPALRSELSKIFVRDHKISQRKAAKILGITESAISQYLKSKRGKEIKFSADELKKVRSTAKDIISDPDNSMKHLYRLSKNMRGSDSMCKLHKKRDCSIGEDCDICKP